MAAIATSALPQINFATSVVSTPSLTRIKSFLLEAGNKTPSQVGSATNRKKKVSEANPVVV